MSSDGGEQRELQDLLDKYQFETEVRVRFPETDAMGAVFHGEFFTYMEVGRTAYMEHIGLSVSRKPTASFENLVVNCECDYHSPARNRDELQVFVRISEIGRSSFCFSFVFVHKEDQRLVAKGSTTHVAIDPEDWTPTGLPKNFREHVRDFEGNYLESNT